MLLHHGEGLTVSQFCYRGSAALPRIEADHAVFRRAKVTRSGYAKRERRCSRQKGIVERTDRSGTGGLENVAALAALAGSR